MKPTSMLIALLLVAGAAPARAGTPQTEPAPDTAKSSAATKSAPADPPGHRHGATAAAGCPMHGAAARSGGPQSGMGGRHGHGGGMRGRDAQHAADRDTIHALLRDHKQITRTTEELPNGVRTETKSADPEVAALIQEHVGRMQDRMEKGAAIRMHDPLFVELFEHHAKIAMKVEAIDGGVRVIETSDDPQVVLLIKQHAKRGIDEFIARGFDRAPEPTPLPEGYKTE